jgi:competence protein ComEC
MFKLRIGYLIAGIVTGLILVFNFIWSLPDGKLHITFCNVGQGDAAYVQFPDGRDMLVDGGPDDSVLQCLGKHMPFWDRTIDIVILSHPEKDHMQGLISVFGRYNVGYFIHSDVEKGTDVDKQLFTLVKDKRIPEKLVTAGERVAIGQVQLAVIWPSDSQIATAKEQGEVLGTTTDSVNEDCIVFWLRYGSFDALFTGDADTGVEGNYIGSQLADNTIEVLKVPHHGSATGMNTAFLDWIKPKLAIISVGKNTYGQPAPNVFTMLADHQARVLRTDQDGDITIVSDGAHWSVMGKSR